MNYLYEALDKPTRLYIKQCPHCGLKYFGKTVSQNIESYRGSGKKWQIHLKKHEVEPIHLWNSDWYYDTSITRFALKFSIINKIVESDKWANLIEETGIGDSFEYINKNRLNIYEGKSDLDRWKLKNLALPKLTILHKTDEEFVNRFKENVSAGVKKHFEINGHHWKGRSHSDETKLKISKKSSVHQKGQGNSQYGTMWITNGNENKKIKKDVDIIPDGWYKGRKQNNLT
jgi:hypothetical protein